MYHYRELVVIIFLFASTATGRVYYLQNLDENRHVDANYPIFEEQASRDLDLSFSAGDSNDDSAPTSGKKAYTVLVPKRSSIDVNRELNISPAYDIVQIPVKKNGLEDSILIPKRKPEVVKIADSKKGEVILELRVIANHESE